MVTEEKKEYKNSIRFIIAVCLIAAAVLAVVLFSASSVFDSYKNYNSQLRTLLEYEGWSLPESTEESDLQLPCFRKPSGNREVTISNTLPQKLEEGTCLAFKSSHTYTVVSIDGKTIYENENEHDAESYDMWNYITLSEDCAGKEITIEFVSKDSYYRGMLPEIFLGPRAEIFLIADSESTLSKQLCFSTVFLGLLVLLFSIVTYSDGRSALEFVFLGLFIVFMGLSLLWQIASPSEAGVKEFALQNIGMTVYGLAPGIYCLYRLFRSTDASAKRILTIGLWISLICFAAVFLLQSFASPETMLPVHFFIYAIFETVYGLCLCSVLFKEQELNHRYRFLISAGIILLMAGFAFDGFTHVGHTAFTALRPGIAGALLFSLFHTAAAVFSAYGHIENQMKLSSELADSRIRLMVNQIKPHYIRNALGSIRAAILEDPKKAYDLLYDFSNYLTFNIESLESGEMVPFSDELKYIKAYAAIEEERLKPRVSFEYDIDTDVFMIPPLSIEPFVENAAKHGVWQKKEPGIVRVSTAQTPTSYIVTVEDDGVGFDTNETKPAETGRGIGSKNAEFRLRQLANADVKIESALGKGTKVTVTIPKNINTEKPGEVKEEKK